MKIHSVPQSHRVLPLNVRRGNSHVGEKIVKTKTRDTTTLQGQNAGDFDFRHPFVLSLNYGYVNQCFPTAGPRPGTGPWHQLYRAARGKYFIVEVILRRIIFVNVSKSSEPERLNNICVANGSDQAAYC
jgi:hypothetical protein